ncbi:MAG TPA: hypothetical protein VG245_04940, partial [Candidatus Dormibacteraeota bacterium]|nr:hypothetical protein [Candidatus Dormibacteraeota bacterium]
MLNRFRKPAQPTAASPDADARACRACGRPATRVCAYVDRRGRACATSWCAEHSVVDGQVGHAAYCRRHAGIAKAMAGSGADSAEMPDLDNRAASLCEWMANDLDGGIRAVLILAQGMHPGSEVSSRPLHRVIQGVPRRSTWMRTWMLADSTGPRWRLALCVDEERDAEVVIRVDSQEIERFVPPWIEHR